MTNLKSDMHEKRDYPLKKFMQPMIMSWILVWKIRCKEHF